MCLFVRTKQKLKYLLVFIFFQSKAHNKKKVEKLVAPTGSY